MKRKPLNLPIQKIKCATCPFRTGSGTEYLSGTIGESALDEASRICHSTGSNNLFHKRTGVPEHLCRGARDLQLQFFHAIGFLDAPTDAAWENKARELSLI